VAKAQKFARDDQILAVIGPVNASVAIQSVEVYSVSKLAMFSSSKSATITDRGYHNVFRVNGRDDVQGSVGAEFAASTLKVKSVYVIHDTTVYGQSIATSFKATAENKGIKILGFEGTEEKSNFVPSMAALKAMNPELIYFGGIYSQAGRFFRQARDEGVNAKFMGPDGMDSSDLVKIGGKSVVGMYYTAVSGPVSCYPESKEFLGDYKRKFGSNPGTIAARSYDAVSIALQAIGAVAGGGAKPTRDEVTATIRDIRYAGITGSIEFDAKGDLRRATYFVGQVGSDDPTKWGDNKLVKRIEVPSP